jgi:hypothetical protein
MSNIHTDLRFSILPEWLLDAGVSDRAVRVYALLARYADSETLQAFPSRETLAKRAGCHWRSIDRAIDELVALGAITKTHRKNGDAYQSNIYTLRRVLTTVSPPTDTAVTGVLTPQSPPTDTGGNLTITTEQEPLKQEPLNDISTKFDQFWEIYPRKVGKGKARQAFEKALEKTDIDTILDGVEAYVFHEGYNDMEFIAHPTSWLNGERWDDEYETPLRKETPGPGKREWVKAFHDDGDHWACEPGEFGCK